MNNIVFELSIVLLLAGGVAFIVNFLKQPSIIAYIVTGLLVGPLGYYHIRQGEVFHALSQIGITLLLFMVGMELDMTQVKRIGRTAILTGIGQVGITSLLGYGILHFLGFSNLTAWYIAIALTFSSTIIVVKLLSEKKDLQSLYGKIVIGIFLLQDCAAMILLIVLSSLWGTGANHGLPAWQHIMFTVLKAGGLIAFVVLQSKYVFPRLLRHIGKSDELLLIFSLAWSLGLAAFVSLPTMGFSLEIGGFLAGLALANSAVHYEIGARIKSLRDFFIILFFIVLGSQLALKDIGSVLVPTILLSAFVLIVNPLIVMVILGLFGYKPRTSFLAGITVGQISEFSLILINLGFRLGHVGEKEVTLVTLIGIVTITLSSYTIVYADKLYYSFKNFWSYLDFRNGRAERGLRYVTLKNHVILIGAHRLGANIVKNFAGQEQFIIVDYNPEVTERFGELGFPALCGDITDPHIQDIANLSKARLIISTIPDFHDNVALIEAIKKQNRKAKLIFAAHDEEEAIKLYEHNIDYAVLPYLMGGLHLAKIVRDTKIGTNLKILRQQHLRVLAKQ